MERRRLHRDDPRRAGQHGPGPDHRGDRLRAGHRRDRHQDEAPSTCPKFPDGTYHAFITPETARQDHDAGRANWAGPTRPSTPTPRPSSTARSARSGASGSWRRTALNAGTANEVVVFGPEAYVVGDFQTVAGVPRRTRWRPRRPAGAARDHGLEGHDGLTLVAFDGTPAMGPAGQHAGLPASTRPPSLP